MVRHYHCTIPVLGNITSIGPCFFLASSLLFLLQVNSVNWSDYANRAFTFVEGLFIIAPLADDDIKEDPNLAYELIIHKEINSSRNAYRCGV